MTSPLRPAPSRRVLAATLLSFASLVLLGSCALSTAGEGGTGGGQTCASDSDCDDKNPCTTDLCTADQLCKHAALPDGNSPPGDAGKQTDCATPVCIQGKLSSVARNEGMACVGAMSANGTCKSAKCVVECSEKKSCPDVGPCATASCDISKGECLIAPLADGTPTPKAQQPPGDCNQQVCIGGMDTKQPDPTDLPKTDTDCDLELCDLQGNASNPARAKDAPCGPNDSMVCDGNADSPKCVPCTDTTVGKCQVDPACGTATCVANQCGFTGTPNIVQVPGDCLKIQCTTAGQLETVPDPDDKPGSTNECVIGVCNGTTPSMSNADTNHKCNNNRGNCDGNGSCVTSCSSNADCAAPDTCSNGTCGCAKLDCNALGGKTCGVFSDGCHGTVTCGVGTKDPNETDVDCGGPAGQCATRCANGKTCAANGDCASGNCVDGMCCDTSCTEGCLACTKAKKGQGDDGTCGPIAQGSDPKMACAQTSSQMCGTDGACDGRGACEYYAQGTLCGASGSNFCTGGVASVAQCSGHGSCQYSTSTCYPYHCSGTACATSCASSDDCVTGYYCDKSGGTGQCKGQQVLGQSCTSNDQCFASSCINGKCAWF